VYSERDRGMLLLRVVQGLGYREIKFAVASGDRKI